MPNKKSGKKPKSTIKSTSKPSKGLGDTIEKITTATGIKKAVEWLSDGKDCGCDRRRDFLNKMFPYKKVECLLEPEYEFLDKYFVANKNSITQSTQRDLINIFNRVFNEKAIPTSCSPCFKNRIHNELKKVYEQYKSDKEQK
jgi:hypothetical protein